MHNSTATHLASLLMRSRKDEKKETNEKGEYIEDSVKNISK